MTKITSFLKTGAIISARPNHLWIGFGEAFWKTFSEIDSTKPAFYFPDFFLQSPASWVQFEQTQEMTLDELLSNLPENNSPPSLKWEQPDQHHFFKTFEELQRAFTQGTLIKAVPYAFSKNPQTMSPTQFIVSLKNSLKYIQNYPGRLYGFWNEREGLLGVTPEILFEFKYNDQNKILSTVALAGTCSKGQDLAAFLRNPKERQEHQITLSGITESLKPFGTIHNGELQVLELPHLNHLLTPIQVELKQPPSFENLIKALHPTPALGAYPKEQGLKWLKSYQSQIPRHRFGAPVGILFPNQTEAHCLVAIRNVQWNAQHMQIGAGCGVIASSLPLREWNEIQVKMEAIKKILYFI